MRIRTEFRALILIAGLVSTLPGQTQSTPASASSSSSGQQTAPTRTLNSPPAQTPANPPQVTYSDGLLSIRAENATLGDVLRAVRNTTGASIESPGFANERVYVNLGPGKPRDILASLLNGSRYDYILLGSQQQPNSVVRVMLTVRQTSHEQPPPSARPTPPPSTAANSDEDETTDTPPDRVAETPPTPPSQPAPAQPKPPNAPGAAGPQQPGQQVKTPEQLLRDLQQLQQQQQQQLQLQQQLQQQNNFGR